MSFCSDGLSPRMPSRLCLAVLSSRRITRFMLVVCSVHLPSWVLSWMFQGPRADERPIFNLDLLLAAVLACVSPLLGIVALVLAWTADAARLASKNFHFMSAFDFLEAARFVDMLNLSSFVTPWAIALAFGLALCVWMVRRTTRVDRRLWLPLLGLMVACVALDALNGSFHGFGLDRDRRLVDTNFAGSPGWNVWRAQRQSALASGPLRPLAGVVTVQALRSWHDMHPRGTSVAVLVESMGLPRDPGLRAWLTARLATPRVTSRWQVSATQERFLGATTSGELRLLCGLEGHYSKLDAASASGCLPRELATHGVRSIGIHGFGMRMFDRRDWWPRIGLTPWPWPEDPAAAGLPMNCNHAFPGVCDGAVLSRAIEEAQQPARLVYALTLDTHLPLSAGGEQLPELLAACTRVAAPEAACGMVQRLGKVLDQLEQRLATSRTTPFVVVVGDHSPPFSERANREVFDAVEVPVFLLRPLEPTAP